jgi:hypothetical protein
MDRRLGGKALRLDIILQFQNTCYWVDLGMTVYIERAILYI